MGRDRSETLARIDALAARIRDRVERQRERSERDRRLSTLAANLAIGGALCRAHGNGFAAGVIFGAHAEQNDFSRWVPGCGRSAP